ncbi:MAG TPA: peptidylprolyl isomerase [Blastocatellia bacterium]|nr:peptidylprolyl isomerase [Blastocatellia bacterium]
MKLFINALALAVVIGCSITVRAQEPELVNEIVARINNDIITRADYFNALNDFKAELTRQMQQSGKSEAEIAAEYEKRKSTVLDILIENLLLEQKAKELGLDVEAEVNQQMAELAKQNGFKNVIEFENALKQQGIDPESARASLRKQFQHYLVIQREVMQPIFMGLDDKDRREFYEKNKEKFTTQGEVTISEIFLPLEGYTAADVEQRARRVVAELRAGMSFVEAVQRHSPASRATRAQNGLIGTFKPDELKPEIATAISSLKPGEVTEPIRIQEGFQIIRLDDRKPPVLRPFDDPDVQRAINNALVFQRSDEARKKYLEKLRQDAFIKITEGYESKESRES